MAIASLFHCLLCSSIAYGFRTVTLIKCNQEIYESVVLLTRFVVFFSCRNNVLFILRTLILWAFMFMIPVELLLIGYIVTSFKLGLKSTKNISSYLTQLFLFLSKKKLNFSIFQKFKVNRLNK